MKPFWQGVSILILVANVALLAVNEVQLHRIVTARQGLERERSMIVAAIDENNRRMDAWNADGSDIGVTVGGVTAGGEAAGGEAAEAASSGTPPAAKDVKPCVQGQDLAPGEECSIVIPFYGVVPKEDTPKGRSKI